MAIHHRTLALFDIENLLRCRPVGALDADYEHAIQRAAAICDLNQTADLVIGVGNRNQVGLFAAARTWPTAALRCLAGRDGGELSLLRFASDLDAIGRTYERVVIGSGDGEFTEFVSALRTAGVITTVVSWRHKLNSRLRRSAQDVRLMDSPIVVCAPSSLAA